MSTHDNISPKLCTSVISSRNLNIIKAIVGHTEHASGVHGVKTACTAGRIVGNIVMFIDNALGFNGYRAVAANIAVSIQRTGGSHSNGGVGFHLQHSIITPLAGSQGMGLATDFQTTVNSDMGTFSHGQSAVFHIGCRCVYLTVYNVRLRRIREITASKTIFIQRPFIRYATEQITAVVGN